MNKTNFKKIHDDFAGDSVTHRSEGNRKSKPDSCKSDNLNQKWNRIRDKNGLFSKDWKGNKNNENKSPFN